jgi:hypothetical protein
MIVKVHKVDYSKHNISYRPIVFRDYDTRKQMHVKVSAPAQVQLLGLSYCHINVSNVYRPYQKLIYSRSDASILSTTVLIPSSTKSNLAHFMLMSQ